MVGTYSQYPLELGWAITIHKSHGLTLKHVIVDWDGGAFEASQVYVTLSRCKSLSSIFLHKPITSSDIKVDATVKKFMASIVSVSSSGRTDG